MGWFCNDEQADHRQWLEDSLTHGKEVASGLSLENNWSTEGVIRDRYEQAEQGGKG